MDLTTSAAVDWAGVLLRGLGLATASLDCSKDFSDLGLDRGKFGPL